MIVDLQSFFDELVIFIIRAEYSNADFLSQSCREICSSSHDLLAIFRVYIQSHTDLHRLLECREGMETH